MLPNQKAYDDSNNQIALFPLEGFTISQPWWGTFSHEGGSRYYATDFQAKDINNNLIYRAPCYAPVDIKLLWVDVTECCALWQSVNPVHFADGTIDYLGLIVYHDNDITSGTYSQIGDIKYQGEIFNHTGTGGNVTGDHVHLETGKGEVNLAQYKFHFLDSTSCRRIVPDDVLFINDTRAESYQGYNWKTFPNPRPEPIPPFRLKKSKFKWVLYANKIRNRWR